MTDLPCKTLSPHNPRDPHDPHDPRDPHDPHQSKSSRGVAGSGVEAANDSSAARPELATCGSAPNATIDDKLARLDALTLELKSVRFVFVVCEGAGGV